MNKIIKNPTKNVKKGTVKPIVKSNSQDLKNYISNVMVATKINADDPQFIPERDGQFFTLRAKNGSTLPHRTTAVIDCGFSIGLLPGWKITVSALPFWAAKGLIVTNPGTCAEGRIKVYLTNVGKEVIVVNPLDKIAQINIEPLYIFNWITDVN